MTDALEAGLAAVPDHGGEMGVRLRGLGWSASGLGAPESWSATLRHAMTAVLVSGAQTVLFRGEDHLAFYNDHYQPTIGSKHPYALGQPAHRHWAEPGHVLEPLPSGVRRTSQAYRGTGRVLGERRLRLLTEFAARLTDPQAWRGLSGQVAGASRQPVILSPLEEALADPDLPVAYRDPLVVVYRSALRLLKLVNTVLGFSRLRSGRLQTRYQPTDLADCTARLASTFRSAAERVDLSLVADCPPLSEPVFVDQEMEERVMPHLISNAVESTFRSDITVRVRQVGRSAQQEAAGTGVGIEQAELLRIFDGLIEDRRQGIGAGLAQLRTDAEETHEHIDDLVDLMLDRVVRRPRRDDVAVLGLELTEINHFALRLPADPTKLSLLRRRLEDFLVAHRVNEADLFDLTVAVSEAVANAIEHPVEPTEPVVTVEVTVRDDVVEASVRDTGEWREATEAGFRGRGLALIGALAELTVSRTDSGTEVTLRRRLRR